MSATFFANELTSLISKRKNTELRTAAEKSLQELNGLHATSEQQLAIDLSRRPAFIDPFLVACGSRNPKYCSGALNCLQRLITTQALPKSRLQDALQAFDNCTDLDLDVQLKILQALPSLLQNYGDELQGDLLSTALRVCSSLQNAKAPTVSGVATATLQQLVNSVFDKVVEEDQQLDKVSVVAEIPGQDTPVKLRPAAYDAYRLFRDLALTTDNRKAKFVELAASPISCLELIHTAIDAHSTLFLKHDELCEVISSSIMPAIIRALSEKLSFQVTVRSVRILGLILRRYMRRFSDECEVALGLVTHMLDQDAAPLWKRILMMETVRNVFSESSLIVEMYASYDGMEGGKPIVQDILSSFVRLSSEKPAAIGLSQQSTLPVGAPTQREPSQELSTLEAAGGMAGVITSALGVSESSVAGISTQWSVPRTPFTDLLDKTDPPSPPETYIYTLVMDCLNFLADALAKIVLPVATQREFLRDKKPLQSNGDARPANHRTRSHSFQQRTVPLDPLTLVEDAAYGKIKSVAGIVDHCWPALLATSSTFLNAALDDQYFKTLVKAYQRFAQVCGLLRHTTSRDALLTTLAKSAIPPHVLNSAFADQSRSPDSTESPRVFSNPKNVLSVDALVSPASSLSLDKDGRSSVEQGKPQLTTRNLLCLRALLNLAIALGPVLDTAFTVVVDTLRQADIILSSVGPQQMARDSRAASGSVRGSGQDAAIVQAFSNEVGAVEAAASRLLESTQDYPDEAFVNVLQAFSQILHHNEETSTNTRPAHSPTPSTLPTSRRTTSGLPGLSTGTRVQSRDYQFVIPKLGHLAELNIARFAASEAGTSGWDLLVQEMLAITASRDLPKEARVAAAEVLCKTASETVLEVGGEDQDPRAVVQRRALSVLTGIVHGIYDSDSAVGAVELQIHSRALDALRGILEQSGDALIAGWNKIMALLSSVFEVEHWAQAHPQGTDRRTHVNWEHVGDDFVSVNLGRVGFAATQVLCSDFLASLPIPAFSSSIELLRRFMGQEEDLNIALTAVSMAWATADFLVSQALSGPMEELLLGYDSAGDFHKALATGSSTSRQTQWLLVLVKLRDVVNESPREVQNAAFRTLCAILNSHGARISTKSWELLLRSVVLEMLVEDARHVASLQSSGEERKSIDTATTSALIHGCFDIVAQQIQSEKHSENVARVWRGYLSALSRYLDLENLTINASVWRALSVVLSNISTMVEAWEDVLAQTTTLWHKRPPTSVDERASEQDNQSAYLAYVELAGEISRLNDNTFTAQQAAGILANCEACIRTSDGPGYGADVNKLSPLQYRIMGLVKSFSSNPEGMAIELIAFASKMILQCTSQRGAEPRKKGPTFIALSGTAITWLQELVPKHVSDSDVLCSDALKVTLEALALLIEAKHAFQAESNSQALWRVATSTAVELAKPVLEDAEAAVASKPGDNPAIEANWTAYVGIASAIVSASPGKQDDESVIYQDMLFDMEKFKTLRNVLIPRLGNYGFANKLLPVYTRSLFEASLIHQPEPGELPPPDSAVLAAIHTIRRGRVRPISPSPREEMCYLCLDELTALTQMHSTRFSQAAAPLLILRLAIPIRAYIADQPLRGTWPQPLSELEELLFCFNAIGNLECQPVALGLEAETGDGVQRDKAHLAFLQPLLARAVGTAGDPWSGAGEVLGPLRRVLEVVAGWG
ncbi:hypothetical protein MBLNU230_g1075t1 [Neophaeotheca triangularis]